MKSDYRAWLFRSRSYMPLPTVALALIFAEPGAAGIAAGLPMVAAGEALRLWGVSIIGAETRVTGAVGASRLVTSGPFACVRNPLYVGNILLYLGLAVASSALFPWLQAGTALWFVFQYHAIVSLEEEFLLGRFGEEYRRYCAAVPRFLPNAGCLLARRRGTARPAPGPEPSWERALGSERRTLQAIALVTLALAVRSFIV